MSTDPAARPRASVLTVTYNQEKYIRQTIESVLDQQTSFPFELVIGEDHSTDATRQIVAEYAERYPGIIRPIFQERNVGAHRNFVQCLRACRGRYVALLEGDDYWLSREKLERQVSILDARPEFAICASRARVVYDDNNQESYDYPMWDRVHFTIEDILRENFIPTCTMVFRLGLLLEIPAWVPQLSFVDWALHVLLAQHGDIILIPETLAAYRVHGHGIASRQDQTEMAKNRRHFQEQLRIHLPEKYAGLIPEASEP